MTVLKFENNRNQISDLVDSFIKSPSLPSYGVVIEAMRHKNFLVPYIATKNINKLNYATISDLGGGPDTILTEQNQIALPIFTKDNEREIHNSDILQNNMILEMSFEQIFDIAKKTKSKIDLILVNPFSDNFPILQSIYDNIDSGNWDEVLD